MSLATQQYLKKYALTDTSLSSTDTSYTDSPVVEVLDPMPPNNLKSILRKDIDPLSKAVKVDEDVTNDNDVSNVLDIARLKELPKLL